MQAVADVAPLDALISARTVWRAGRSAVSAPSGVPTGHAALDALLPLGGWPRNALTEVLLPADGVGELALGYDRDTDRVMILAREVLDSGSEEPQEGEPAGSEVRFWCTRNQLLAMSRWGLEVSGRGRPVCPYCGQPMEPSGHFCPKRNGYKH